MAKLVKMEKKQIISTNMEVTLNTGKVKTYNIAPGDIVQGLRYTESGEVKSATGRVKGITTNQKKRQNTGKVEDHFKDDNETKYIMMDCSTEYNADTRSIIAKEVVEFDADKDLDINSVHMVPEGKVILDMFYSNMKTEHQEISIGDKLENMTILTSPGKPAITGDFDVVAFRYESYNGKPMITGLGLKYADQEKYVWVVFEKILGFHEIEQRYTETPEELIDALENAESGAIIYVTEDIEVPQTVEVPEGVDYSLELGNQVLTAPEPVNNRSLYLFNVNGELTIDGGTIEARGIQSMDGGRIIVNDAEIVSRDANGGAAIWVYEGGSLIINSGTFTTRHVGSVKENSGPGCLNNSGNCQINSGTFESPNQRCYAIINKGNMVIAEDANIVVAGAHGGISCDGGNTDIYSGTYSSENFYALYVSNDFGSCNVDVYGGEFTGKEYSVHVGSDGQSSVDAVVHIHGGRFNNPLRVQGNVAEGYGIIIDGGEFKVKPDASMIAEGFAATENPNEDGYYEVLPVDDGE